MKLQLKKKRELGTLPSQDSAQADRRSGEPHSHTNAPLNSMCSEAARKGMLWRTGWRRNGRFSGAKPLS
jgi:hypothetical protein